jgi:YVTN family beta-propeller protein
VIRLLAASLLLTASAAARAETIWVSDEMANVVHVIDGATLKEVARLPVGKRPRGLAFSPERRQ